MCIKKSTQYLYWILFWSVAGIDGAFCQSFSGYWLGVTYPSNPNQQVYNYFANFTQTGTTLGGTAQTANPNLPFGGLAYVKGTTTMTKVRFKESDDKGSINTKDVCYWDLDLTYDPIEESLKGTYTNIVNPSYCDEIGGGKVELYRIVVKSGTKFCKGSPINLQVTGKNLKWYDSDKKTKLIGTGNNFSPQLSQTTTLYITQTLYNSESPPIPIKIDIVDIVINDAKVTASTCGKKDGAISLTATGSTGLQYSADGGLTFQSSTQFSGLAANTYKIQVKDADGCTTNRSVEVKDASAPTITDVKIQEPVCGQPNGKLTITVAGGIGALQYSLDGTTFQTSNIFDKLADGNFTISVKDNNGCATTKQATLAKSIIPKIASVQASPTTCGKDNGEIIVKTTVSNAQFSIDGNTFEANTSFKNIKSGTYTVTLKDAAGCVDMQVATVAPSTGPTLVNLAATPVSCSEADGKLTIQATGNGLEYSLNAGTLRSTNSFDKLTAGEYVILVKDGANCTVTQKITLRAECQKMVFIPTGFSPNGDGLNDQLAAYFPFPSLKFNSISVFNRWGTAIYGTENVTLKSGDALWDGFFNGKPPMLGNYVVVAEAAFEDGTTHVFRQQVEILQ